MAWHYDKKDIVIDGFANGIADSAEQGIIDMRNVNIVSAPNEASVNFATAAITIPPAVTTASVTFTAATDIATWTPTATLYNGLAITFGATTGGVTAGVIYWVGNVSGSTFKIYNAINSNDPSNLVDLTANVSTTFTTIQLGAMTYAALSWVSRYNFFIDANGRAWWVKTATNVLVNLGNTTLTNAHGNGIVVYAGFIFVFRDTAIDYLPVDAVTNTSSTASQWIYGWKTDLSSNLIHQAIASQDNAIYFCNDKFVGSVLTNAGSSFDPTNGGSYTYTASALLIPADDGVTYLAELGTNLLVGGIRNFIYPWDRLSTSYAYPLIFAENNIQKIVSTNANAYVFAGNRGRIYQTNGSNVQLYKKFPDQISALTDPYWSWGGAMYWRNQLFFGIQSSTNAGGSFETTGGVWAIDLTSNALRGVNSLSYGSPQTGTMPVIAPNISTSTPAGAGFFAAWTNNSVNGLDVTTTSPYASSIDTSLQIDSDLIPVGTYFKPDTQGQIQFKLSLPLVTGETFRIQQRPYLRSSWTTIGTTTGLTGTNQLSDAYPVNYEKYQYLQFRAQAVSTASSPSYCRLTELRLTPG